MERVLGLGGVFFKSNDPKALGQFYKDALGAPVEDWGGAIFRWREREAPNREASTVWAAFSTDTKHFAPSTTPVMFNFRVRDLEAMRAQLRAAGATVDEKIEETPEGKFGWAMDPDGNRIELWEPAPGK